MFKVLLAEDDRSLNKIISTKLKNEGYEVLSVFNGKQALDLLEENHVDLLLTDIMMPEIDGFELVKILRNTQYYFPILVFTAKSQFEALEKAFEMGVDDYLVKPIRLTELSLRVKALLRRFELESQRQIKFKNLLISYDQLTITDIEKQEVLQIPKKEFYVLYKLLSNPNKIFTRIELLDEIWGFDDNLDERVVDACIKRIRRKTESFDAFEILTIRGLGYKGIINE